MCYDFNDLSINILNFILLAQEGIIKVAHTICLFAGISCYLIILSLISLSFLIASYLIVLKTFTPEELKQVNEIMYSLKGKGTRNRKDPLYAKLAYQFAANKVKRDNKHLYSKKWIPFVILTSSEQWRLYKAAVAASATGELQAAGYDVHNRRIVLLDKHNASANSTPILVSIIYRHDPKGGINFSDD